MQSNLEINNKEWIKVLTLLLLDSAKEHHLEYIRKNVHSNTESLTHLFRRNVIGLRALAKIQEQGIDIGDANRKWKAQEEQRVCQGMSVIKEVFEFLEDTDIKCVVIKTLDQQPDQGDDIDLLLDGDISTFEYHLVHKLGAKKKPPTLSDRFAQKTNFTLPNGIDLELHLQKLGQIGEHTLLPRQIIQQKVTIELDGQKVNIPTPEAQYLLLIWQRVYRHFDFRVADIVNMNKLFQQFDPDLRRL
ncbi:MAG: hypothetical protein GY816_15905, partial [Cytophagales bacterium]|nr:hypothetical protein [Cytophagales bacterium]